MKTKLHLRIIALFSYLIPRRFRSDWTEEWNAELQYRESKPGRDLIRPSLGAFWDALAMQSRRLEEDFWQDVRYGVRTFASSRGVTAAVILSLSLGIGANTAIFSLIDPLLLKKLPVKNPDELLLFQWRDNEPNARSYALSTSMESRYHDGGISRGGVFSYLIFKSFRDAAGTNADIFAFSRLERSQAVADGHAELLTGQWVSGEYFDALGISALPGRTIGESDDQPSAAPVVMLSHGYWSRRFALDPSVLGRVITVEGTAFTIAGIVPPEFSGTLQVDDAPDIYLPMALEPLVRGRASRFSQPENWWIWIMARPSPGVSPVELRDNLVPVFQQAGLQGIQVAAREKRVFGFKSFSEFKAPDLEVVSGSLGLSDNRRSYASTLMILSALSVLVLLIACANVANLLLARATARQQEIALRVALGAGRLRLVRQLLTESLLLAVCGGACGLVAAYFGKNLLLNWGPWNSSAANISAGMGIRIFAFTFVLMLLCSLASGVIPAVISTRRGLDATMKANARTASSSSRIGKILLASQAAMSVVLVIGAGLFIATVYNLRSAVVASEPVQVLEFTVDALRSGHEQDRQQSLWDQLLSRITAVPGVQVATLSSSFSAGPMPFEHPTPGQSGAAIWTSVGPGFFGTIGIPLAAGRDFTERDDDAAPPVAIVNESFVQHYFPKEDVLGKDIGAKIVGVARNVDYSQLRTNAPPTIYTSYRQYIDGVPLSLMTFRVRTSGDPSELFPDIRKAIREVDPLIVPFDVGTLAGRVDRTLATENMFARLSTLFGAVALLLTSIGFFGMLSYGVARRTKEFGVRMAMGARPSYVMRLVLRDGVTLVVIGIAIGIGGALVAVRYIASHLFGLVPNNPFVIAGAAITVMVIAIVASLAPARRASRVAPVDALRYE